MVKRSVKSSIFFLPLFVAIIAFGAILLAGCEKKPVAPIRTKQVALEWQKEKLHMNECKQMCDELDMWFYQYRHYRNKQCVCRTDFHKNYWQVNRSSAGIIEKAPLNANGY